VGPCLPLERLAHTFISAHADLFYTRAREGRIREGHGDLRAEHVLVNGDVRIVDCVEFDPELRELDVADDLAFLVFDLAARGGGDLGDGLVEAYRGAGGDPGDDSLIAFYAVYRALVRAKVALVRSGELPPFTSGARGEESAYAHDLIALAERFAWRARLPLAIVVCGLPASGKSHLAGALADLAGLPHLSSDRIRKELRGLGSTQRASAETYTADWNARTYAELGQRAAQEVGTSRGAIVDATFRHRVDRQAFASGFAGAASTLFLECQAPRSVLIERAAGREHDRERVSDADIAVVLAEQDSWEPFDEVPANVHLVLRTDRQLQEIVDDVLALLDCRLLRLAPAPE
jgi:uncharacterized protein